MKARPSAYTFAAIAFAALGFATPNVARAEAPRFLGEVDRNQVTAGEPFIYQVTLSVGNDKVSDYRLPDFKGLRLLSAPRAPSQSTQMQFGGAGMFVEVSYTWRYEVAALQKGNLSIGPARIKVNGQEFKSSVVTVSVVGASNFAGGAQPAQGSPPRDPNATAVAPPAGGAPPADGSSFIRLATDKEKAYVGEAIAATWFLYMNAPHDKYDVQVEPTMEGFWTEDVAIPNRRGSMILNEELLQGRRYQVGAVLKKTLFPLHAGKLKITPMEAEIARVDFFGTQVRSQRVKAAPVELEILPLPKDGQPAGFDPANVGTFALASRVDRTQVATGDAVTLTLEISGRGNIRKVGLPPLPDLDGWKKYDPRTNVVVDPATGVEGKKTAEILLLPSRPGKFQIPALVLDYFDPGSARYERATTPAIDLTVTGAALAGAGGTSAAGAAPTTGDAPLDNVIAGEIRPIHAKAELRRALGATLLRSPAFVGLLLAPPLLLALVTFGLGLRDRRTEDTGANRRRRSRQKVRAHFVAAEAHRQRREIAAFYIELDRVLREAISHRLGATAAGMTLDELRGRASALGLGADEVARLIAALEEGDRARFAPGSVPGDDAALGAALERASDLVARIESGKPQAGRA